MDNIFAINFFLYVLMTIYNMKVIFLKSSILMGFFSFGMYKRNSRSHGERKNSIIKCKICTEKRINTSLKVLSVALNNHDWHGLLSFLSFFPI